MRKVIPLFLMSFLLLSAASFAQVDEGYQKEFDYGINFNTRGGLIGGGMIKSSRTLNEQWNHFWGLELVEVKHPKEIRYPSQTTGDIYILGKQNYLFVLRPHYGRERVFFRKAAESGVQVNGIVAAGPSLGFLAPYYIYYNHGKVDPNSGHFVEDDIQLEKFDPDMHSDNRRIMGNASFLTGLTESNINVGAHIKTGVSFEYGRYQESVTGVETGFLFEAYPKKLVIIPQAENNSTFFSFYFTLYYGRRK